MYCKRTIGRRRGRCQHDQRDFKPSRLHHDRRHLPASQRVARAACRAYKSAALWIHRCARTLAVTYRRSTATSLIPRPFEHTYPRTGMGSSLPIKCASTYCLLPRTSAPGCQTVVFARLTAVKTDLTMREACSGNAPDDGCICWPALTRLATPVPPVGALPGGGGRRLRDGNDGPLRSTRGEKQADWHRFSNESV